MYVAISSALIPRPAFLRQKSLGTQIQLTAGEDLDVSGHVCMAMCVWCMAMCVWCMAMCVWCVAMCGGVGVCVAMCGCGGVCGHVCGHVCVAMCVWSCVGGYVYS